MLLFSLNSIFVVITLLIYMSGPAAGVLVLLLVSLIMVLTAMAYLYSLYACLVLVLVFWGSMMVLLLYCLCISPKTPFLFSPGNKYLFSIVYITMVILSCLWAALLKEEEWKSLSFVCFTWDDVKLGEDLLSLNSISIFFYSVCNLLLILLVACEMAKLSKGPLILKS